MSSVDVNSTWNPEILDRPAVIVDETTGLGSILLDSVELRAIAEEDGTIQADHWDLLDEFTLDSFEQKYLDSVFDRSQLRRRIMVTKFAGRKHNITAIQHRASVTDHYLDEYIGRGIELSRFGYKGLEGLFYANESANTAWVPLHTPKGIEDHIALVTEEIFDGRNDLGIVDISSILENRDLVKILGSLFINRPGKNGGLSSLRHIFKGDKSGLHVPAFADEFPDLLGSSQDIWTPFDAHITIGGVSKLKVINDSGEKRFEPAATSMFPIGMDSMSVLQSIIESWSHRRDSASYLKSQSKHSRIYELPFNVGANVENHTIRIVTDATNGTDKIRTAFPIVQ